MPNEWSGCGPINHGLLTMALLSRVLVSPYRTLMRLVLCSQQAMSNWSVQRREVALVRRTLRPETWGSRTCIKNQHQKRRHHENTNYHTRLVATCSIGIRAAEVQRTRNKQPQNQ